MVGASLLQSLSLPRGRVTQQAESCTSLGHCPLPKQPQRNSLSHCLLQGAGGDTYTGTGCWCVKDCVCLPVSEDKRENRDYVLKFVFHRE